jgi:hypothetical protein
MIAAKNYPLNCGLATTEFARGFEKRTVANRSFDVSATLVNRITSPGTLSYVTEADKINAQRTSASYVTDVVADIQFRVPQYVQEVVISSSDESVLSGPPDALSPLAYESDGLCTVLATSSDGETAAIAVTTTSGDASTTTEFDSWVSGSLARHCSEAITSRLSGELPVYSLQDGTTFIRNPNCWAADVDLTCASPWNSTGGSTMAGTLISPRHVLFCRHLNFFPAVGATIKFVSLGNEVISRTISAIGVYPGSGPLNFFPDIAIGLLDADVPESITFAEILPDDWKDYMPSLERLASVQCLRLNQNEQATTARFIGVLSNRFQCRIPPGNELPFFQFIVAGDSGSPVFLVINSRPVILGTFTHGGAGIGTFITSQISQVNEIMTSLGGGYQLTDVDISEFPTY